MIKKARKATPFYVAVAIVIWILAGCSNSGAAQVPPSVHKVTVVAGTPKAQLEAWKDGPGGKAFIKLGTDMQSIDATSISPAQANLLISDVKAAEAYPVPASVDPGGYYLDSLVHFKKGLIAAKNANVYGVLVHMNAGTSEMEHFTAEVKKVKS